MNPKSNFNACDDFIQTVTISQILTIALDILGMESLESTPSMVLIPSPETFWMKSMEERKSTLAKICRKICTSIDFSLHKRPVRSADNVYEYNKHLLSIGCFYMEFKDAIREGDGKRVLCCWRYMLPLFRFTQHKNYCIEAFNLLCQYSFRLPPRQAEELIWSRFINTHGVPGRNIPLDLHLEHLNRLCKTSIAHLGPNKMEEGIVRCSNILGTIQAVLDIFDNDNDVLSPSGSYHRASFKKDLQTLVKELHKLEAFKVIPGRKYKTFPNPVNRLHSKPMEDMISWIKDHL